MSTFDLLADLPLRSRATRSRGCERDVSSGFLRKTTVIHLHGGGHEGVGEDVTYDAEDHDVAAGAPAPILAARRRRWTLGVVLRAPRRARPVPRRAAAARGLALLPPLGVTSPPRSTSRCARPGASLHEALGREPRPVTFVISLRLTTGASRRPLEPIERAARALPDAALQARPDAATGTRRSIAGARRDRRGRLGRLQGPTTRARSSTTPPTRCSTRAIAEALPGRLDRGPRR